MLTLSLTQTNSGCEVQVIYKKNSETIQTTKTTKVVGKRQISQLIQLMINLIPKVLKTLD